MDEDFSFLPLRSVLVKSLVPQDFFIGKSGLIFQNWQQQDIFVWGNSFGNTPEDCLKTAQFEVYERLFAYYDFAKHLINGDGCIECHSWINNKQTQHIHAAHILLGEIPGYTGKLADSTGLAFGRTYEQAFQNAALEVIERHLLGELWYKNTKLCSLEGSEKFGSIEINFYSIDSNPCIPFVIAVLKDTEQQIWLCGSAVRIDVIQAREHALSEALMLYNSLILKDEARCLASVSNERFYSLSSSKSIERENYFDAQIKLRKTISLDKFTTLEFDKLLNLVLNSNHIRVVVIYSSFDKYILRVLHPEATSLAEIRRSSNKTVLDPFF